MKTAEQIIKEFAIDFIEKNWKHQTYFDDTSKKNKNKLIEEINENLNDAMWVIDELAIRGFDKKHLIGDDVEHGGLERIININDNYIKVSFSGYPNYGYSVTLMKKATKMIEVITFEEIKQ